jgi:hypothetical protein
MKDDKVECQKVIRLIEKYWKKDNSKTELLSYHDYCIMWEKVLLVKA